MVRIFAALDLPPGARDKIADIGKEISKSEAELNFVNPEISHITLKFIGEVEEDLLEKVLDSLSSVKYGRYSISLRGVSLNSIKSPRVIWINGYDNGSSAKLAGLIDLKLKNLGIREERRPFKIHATVARVKRWHPSVMPMIKKFGDKEICSFETCGFKLKKSTLTPKGPVYEDILEVGFDAQ
ncbi:2'-5' RNA ligase [Methanomicrobium sp. W14]|uniref:RNA 2',3'-cyclic phosphodiesterase n=1 Tax=Methanomicrobium sp. W14 TaxID=2817839 RepID=UPI001AE754D1|nr:RNA 2',3'-cyclic phosphodiesterase [Methanomicrobium sp. W14]MBP2132516.1 2'-5' RNA ligase [Methanomicrobium sp. W14]